MAEFQYLAVTNNGENVKGTVKANNIEQAKVQLRMDGLTPITVKAQSIFSKDINIGGEKKVTNRDLSVFCRQFSSILNAGVTVVDALNMLADQTQNKTLVKALKKTSESVQQGETLAQSMAKHPKIFPEMFVNMIEAGEVSGSLETCVIRMGTQFEKSAKLAGILKKASIYPIAVVVVAVVVLIVMSTAVVPQFANMFASMGTDLPGSTKAVMAISDFLKEKWWLLIIIVIGLIAAFKYFGKTEIGKTVYGTIAIKVPIIGPVNIKTQSASFARTMSTLVSSGMGISVALEITAKAMKNIIYRRTLQKAKIEVEQGINLSVPIRKAKVYPTLVPNMIAIGEETGNVETMLDKVAEYFEEEAELATESMSEMLQPLIIVVLGGLVGWMVLAMYQPMISMYGGLGNL
ncbi:MAG: type II secretion system F family protein [Lachnospiraceae bacterium]|nr:type II secretion system F family protein [Lachnospiraceae bacterium]